MKNRFLVLLLKVSNYLFTKERELNAKFKAKVDETYVLWWKESVDELSVDMVDEACGVFRIDGKSTYTFVKSNFVLLDSLVQLDMAGDKALTYQILSKLNLPVPFFHEYAINEVHDVFDLIEKSNKKFVVKPCFGTGGGQGVTTGISTLKEFKKASNIAASFCSKLIVEEFISGDSYRLLYLDGNMIDAVKRDPPSIEGDGINSIKSLIEEVNNNRLNSHQLESFYPLIIDMDLINTLKAQKLEVSSVLSKGEKINVKTVINQNSRHENHRVTEKVHPSIIAQGTKIVNYYGLKLAGVDVITCNIGVPLESCDGYINEINTTPGLHVHKLVSEPNVDNVVFTKLLTYLLANGITKVNLNKT